MGEQRNAFVAEIEEFAEKNNALVKCIEDLKSYVERLENEIESDEKVNASMEIESQLEREIQELQRKYDTAVATEKAVFDENHQLALDCNSKLQTSLQEEIKRNEQQKGEMKKLKEIVEAFQKENDGLRKEEKYVLMVNNLKHNAFMCYTVVSLAVIAAYYYELV